MPIRGSRENGRRSTTEPTACGSESSSLESGIFSQSVCGWWPTKDGLRRRNRNSADRWFTPVPPCVGGSILGRDEPPTRHAGGSTGGSNAPERGEWAIVQPETLATDPGAPDRQDASTDGGSPTPG